MLKDLIKMIMFVALAVFLMIIYDYYIVKKTHFAPQEEIVFNIENGEFVEEK